MSWFDRFHKKSSSPSEREPPINSAPTFVPDKASTATTADSALRKEVGRQYDCGVNPLHAIRAMLHDRDGTPITDAQTMADIWLGVNDLLDRDGIENTLRSQLVGLRDVFAKTIEDSGAGAKTFVTNYRASTRQINEMKTLQSYKLKLTDAAGVMDDLEAFNNMLTEIEHERAHNPGSRAQDISEEALANLYRLRDNWDDPTKLNSTPAAAQPESMPAAAPENKKSAVEAWIGFLEDSCNRHLRQVLNYKHPDWELAEKAGDFRTLVTIYAAACQACEQHIDHMFSEWIKCAKQLGINTDKTTGFYYMVNRRFSHLAQIRCYLDYQLKLTLVPVDERTKALPQLAKFLSPEMSSAFFPTPAAIPS